MILYQKAKNTKQKPLALLHFPVYLYNPCHLIFILLGYSKTFEIPKYMYTISICIAAKFNIKFYHMVNIPATLQVFLTKWPFLQAQWRAVYPNESLADSSQRLWVIQLWHKGKSKNSEYQIILNHIKFFIFFLNFIHYVIVALNVQTLSSLEKNNYR